MPEFYRLGMPKENIDEILLSFSNDNLLDNWYFFGGGINGKFPINQRGETTYPNVGQKCFDRWLGTAAVTLGQNGVTITHNAESQKWLGQKIYVPSGCIERYLRTYTLSAIVDGQLYFGTVTANANTPGATFTAVDNDAVKMYVQFGWGDEYFLFVIWTKTKDITVSAAKVEFGFFQTLAKQTQSGLKLLETPIYGAELAKCQRFLLRLQGNAGIGFGDSATNANIFVPLPVSMRKVPSFEGVLSNLYPPDGNIVTRCSVGGVNTSTNMIWLSCEGTGFVIGKPYACPAIDGFLNAE